jgi:ABC-type phosphate transport system substrate-binding protein
VDYAATRAAAQLQNLIAINGLVHIFPFQLIDMGRVEYQNVNPNVNINYQSIGSGGGVRQFTERTVDFGASDASLTALTPQNALYTNPKPRKQIIWRPLSQLRRQL